MYNPLKCLSSLFCSRRHTVVFPAGLLPWQRMVTPLHQIIGFSSRISMEHPASLRSYYVTLVHHSAVSYCCVLVRSVTKATSFLLTRTLIRQWLQSHWFWEEKYFFGSHQIRNLEKASCVVCVRPPRHQHSSLTQYKVKKDAFTPFQPSMTENICLCLSGHN